MWVFSTFSRLDYKVVFLVSFLLLLGLFTIFSIEHHYHHVDFSSFWSSKVGSQIKWICLGWIIFFLTSSLNYHKLREWTWILYLGMLLALIGLFFFSSIHGVHRWYRIPWLGMSFQPSEYTKLVIILAISWIVERRRMEPNTLMTTLICLCIVLIPFLLILKQPDLGTALILWPIALFLLYLGHVRSLFLSILITIMATIWVVIVLIFLEIIPYETLKPFLTIFLKEYQFERFNPNTHHQKAASTAIAIGGALGKGYGNTDFTLGGWLPEPYNDSIFAVFGELYGFLGLTFLLILYYYFLHFCFQVVLCAKDYYGKLLASGISVMFTVHVLLNVSMICGIMPITGVPLIFMSYGGSSILMGMTALGLMQSIYSRRFMF